MIDFKLEVDEINVILAALGELPAKTSMSVIQKIHQQVAEYKEAQPAEEADE